MQAGARFPENMLFRLRTEKGPQNEPQIYTKTAPRGLQMAQNGLQNRCSNFDQISASFWTLLGAKMGAKISPKTLKISVGAPRAAQRPPGSHFGAILAPFWTPRGLKIDQESSKIQNQPSKGRRTNAQHTTTTQRNATHHATPRNATQRNTQRNSQRNTQRNTAFRGPLSTASWPF